MKVTQLTALWENNFQSTRVLRNVLRGVALSRSVPFVGVDASAQELPVTSVSTPPSQSSHLPQVSFEPTVKAYGKMLVGERFLGPPAIRN